MGVYTGKCGLMYVCMYCMFVGHGGSILCYHSTHTQTHTYIHSETGNRCDFCTLIRWKSAAFYKHQIWCFLKHNEYHLEPVSPYRGRFCPSHRAELFISMCYSTLIFLRSTQETLQVCPVMHQPKSRGGNREPPPVENRSQIGIGIRIIRQQQNSTARTVQPADRLQQAH